MRRAFLLVILMATACAAPQPSSDGGDAWVGTITTEANVTTVVNEAGSVWGGAATLVEEASIGVEAGPDEYMFGRAADVWATDEHILVLDSQIPVVRVFDLNGEHVMDIGRSGQGPGEFTTPAGLAVSDDGDILVIESSLKVAVFSADGESKATWNSGSPFQVYVPEMLVLGLEGQVWVPHIARDPIRFGRAFLDPEGNASEPIFPPDLGWEPECVTYARRGNENSYCNIPFQPAAASELMLDGAWVVGISSDYAFEVHNVDGTTLRVRRYWDPVAVSAEEAAEHKENATELVRESMGAGPEWTWNGAEIPAHKPAYTQITPDRNGRLWILRDQASRLSTDCFDDSPQCWRPEGYWLDAFGADGRFLGSVTLPRRPAGHLFINDTTIVSTEVDEAGTYVVKRYRLVLPGEQ